MRQIGTLPDEQQARTFEDYVLTLGVRTQIDEDPDGWAVWVYEEDQVEQARGELEKFVADPDDPSYAQASRRAARLRREAEKQAERARKRHVNVREHWERPLSSRAPVTFGLIAISLAVALLSSSFESLWRLADREEPVLTWMRIVPTEAAADGVRWWPGRGLADTIYQPWRVVTPIFIHFTIIHILFNMLWLRDLGSTIEGRRGTRRFILMVLVIAVLSNLAQYLVSGHPNFGGMSGVVFGLFGYIWMKSRFDPESGFFMPPQVVFLMIAWFLICFTGVIGNIANTAHTVGLISGLVMGYASKFWRDLSRQ
jgi:GlpG protein